MRLPFSLHLSLMMPGGHETMRPECSERSLRQSAARCFSPGTRRRSWGGAAIEAEHIYWGFGVGRVRDDKGTAPHVFVEPTLSYQRCPRRDPESTTAVRDRSYSTPLLEMPSVNRSNILQLQPRGSRFFFRLGHKSIGAEHLLVGRSCAEELIRGWNVNRCAAITARRLTRASPDTPVVSRNEAQSSCAGGGGVRVERQAFDAIVSLEKKSGGWRRARAVHSLTLTRRGLIAESLYTRRAEAGYLA